jgi:hypothetical protein
LTGENAFIWRKYTTFRWDGTNEVDLVDFMNDAVFPPPFNLPRYSIVEADSSQVMIHDEQEMRDFYVYTHSNNVVMDGYHVQDMASDSGFLKNYYHEADIKKLLPGLLLDGKSVLVEIVTELDAEDSIEVPLEWNEDVGRSDYKVTFAPDASLLGKVSFSVKDDLTKTATGMTVVVTAIDNITLVLSGAVHCLAVTP